MSVCKNGRTDADLDEISEAWRCAAGWRQKYLDLEKAIGVLADAPSPAPGTGELKFQADPTTQSLSLDERFLSQYGWRKNDNEFVGPDGTCAESCRKNCRRRGKLSLCVCSRRFPARGFKPRLGSSWGFRQEVKVGVGMAFSTTKITNITYNARMGYPSCHITEPTRCYG